MMRRRKESQKEREQSGVIKFLIENAYEKIDSIPHTNNKYQKAKIKNLD